MFLVKSELSITTYLFLVFYRSTTLQARSFLKNIDNFLCKSKLVNNRKNSFKATALETQYFPKKSFAIVSQKYRELSMQVLNNE
jgi:hypothetical protein